MLVEHLHLAAGDEVQLSADLALLDDRLAPGHLG